MKLFLLLNIALRSISLCGTLVLLFLPLWHWLLRLCFLEEGASNADKLSPFAPGDHVTQTPSTGEPVRSCGLKLINVLIYDGPVRFVLPCLQSEWCLHSFQGHDAGAWSGAEALWVLYGRMGDSWAVKTGACGHAELPWGRAHLCSSCGEGPHMSWESACGKWQVPERTETPNQSHGECIRKKSCLLFLSNIF